MIVVISKDQAENVGGRAYPARKWLDWRFAKWPPVCDRANASSV